MSFTLSKFEKATMRELLLLLTDPEAVGSRLLYNISRKTDHTQKQLKSPSCRH